MSKYNLRKDLLEFDTFDCRLLRLTMDRLAELRERLAKTQSDFYDFDKIIKALEALTTFPKE